MQRGRSGDPLVALACASALALALALTGAASASAPGRWVPTYDGDSDVQTTLRTAYLTRDGADVFAVRKVFGDLLMAAPETNGAGNTREVIWPAGSSKDLDAATCATWVGETEDFAQEGLALRVRHSGATTTAITVTKNIVYGAHWAFNVHAWDSSSATPFTLLGQWDLSPVILDHDGQYQPKPWRVCFRAVGTTVGMKIWWPSQMPQPSWSDPDYSRTLTIPAAYSRRGHAGWYIGHLRPGMSAWYDGLATWRTDEPAPGG